VEALIMNKLNEYFAKRKDNEPCIVVCFEAVEMQPVLQYKKLKNGHLSFNATLQTVDGINRNNKLYPKDVLMEALSQPRIVDMVKRNSWFGEIAHPWNRKNFLRSIDILPVNISHRICTQPVLQGNSVVSEVHTVEPMGKTLDSWIEDENCDIGFSMRGITPYELEKNTPIAHKVIRSPMTVLTFDSVAYPSHSEARIASTNSPIQKEGGEIDIPINEVSEFVSMESQNFRIFKEELGIDIDRRKPVVKAEGGSLECTLKDGRLARLKVEQDIIQQIASYI
jgi:hypothetical protein